MSLLFDLAKFTAHFLIVIPKAQIVKNIILLACLVNAGTQGKFSEWPFIFIFPDSAGWNILNENQTLGFVVKSTHDSPSIYFSIEGADGLGIEFDSLGHFRWTPSLILLIVFKNQKISRLSSNRSLPDGKRERREVTFLVRHVNRPPVVEELPIVYVKQSNLNTYQIQSDFVYDPDGDPLVFKSILSQMPEGSALSSQGAFTWNPSRTQFASLKNQPLVVEFIAQDQPEKAETQGKLKIAQTQLDLPPEIMIVPGDSMFTIKEDEILNLKLYVSDPTVTTMSAPLVCSPPTNEYRNQF